MLKSAVKLKVYSLKSLFFIAELILTLTLLALQT